MTEKLFYQDPYQFEFEADVVSQIQGEKRPAVVLDRTCFYPEGGGQPSDQGFLNDIRVIDVQYRENEILHYTEKPVSAGKVKAKVDRRRRIDFMQQHTGQHILSQCLLRVGGFNTVSVHFGEEYTAIETDAQEITPRQEDQIEKMANDLISGNSPVRIDWIDPADVDKYNIRRPPPDVEKVRIVQVGDFDVSACGGLHVRSTGEIGLIKLTGQQKIRNRLRIMALIGERAYEDYRVKTRLLAELSRILTCGEDTMVSRVEDLENRLRETNRTISKLQAELMSAEAEQAVAGARKIQNILFVQKIFHEADNNLLKMFIDPVLSAPDRMVAVFNVRGTKLNWMVGHSAGNTLKLREILAPVLPTIDGKGGGSDSLMQGGGTNSDGITRFIHQLNVNLERMLSENE